ncbi:hypothetical protein [Pseudoxanthomonas gei]|uniref:hypothetical protein n=1 Tax=Pseudoxanthomonas gei TaxID=1383030 RepID=UPI001B876325|nr:hypothetical protein [Pseudoxanthomonas gei]
MPLYHRTLFALCLLVPAVFPATAQEGPTTVVPVENVRLDYAQVLAVEPVYQTLRASRTEMKCEEKPAPRPAPPMQDDGRWNKLVDSVKGVFTRDPEPQPKVEPAKPTCRMVPVEREFRRPIAYDVDYLYKGFKYRSRLAEDPGNRLRIRVSVMPYIPGQSFATP